MAAKLKRGSRKMKRKTAQNAAGNAARRRRSKNTQNPSAREPERVGRPPAGTEDWVPHFLGALEEGLHVRDAAKAALVHNSVVYRRRKADPAFHQAMIEARTFGKEELEAEANRRAYEGVEKPVFYKGKVCGRIREYSDQILMFLLRAYDPNMYRDNSKIEHVGKDGAALPGPVVYIPDNGRNLPEPLEDVDSDDTAIDGR
jgi:hypothetical protein